MPFPILSIYFLNGYIEKKSITLYGAKQFLIVDLKWLFNWKNWSELSKHVRQLVHWYAQFMRKCKLLRGTFL